MSESNTAKIKRLRAELKSQAAASTKGGPETQRPWRQLRPEENAALLQEPAARDLLQGVELRVRDEGPAEAPSDRANPQATANALNAARKGACLLYTSDAADE